MYLHFTRPEELGRIVDKSTSPVALYASDDIVAATFDSFGYDPETVVLHRRAAADTTEKALLNPLLELDHSDSGRRSGDLDRDLADGEPRDGNTKQT